MMKTWIIRALGRCQCTLFLAFYLLGFSPSSIAADNQADAVVIWDAAKVANTFSDLTELLDPQNKPVAVVNVYRVKRVLEAARRVQAAAGPEARLWLVYLPGGRVNAFAYAKDGLYHILISTSMLDLLGDDIDAYAYLIGHEIAHIVRDHGAQRDYLRQMLQESRAIDPRAHSGRAGLGLTESAIRGAIAFDGAFNRDQEREADQLGLKYMLDAGFDTKGALRLHQALQSTSHAAETVFARTHPSDQERLSTIQRLVTVGASSSKRRQLAAFSETETTSLSSEDEQLARIAEAITIVKKEFISVFDDRELIVGCRNGIARLANESPEEPPVVEQFRSSPSEIAKTLAVAREKHSNLGVSQLTDACLSGMIERIDRRSAYLDRFEAHELRTGAPNVAGVGVEFKIQDGLPRIVRPLEGSPAYRAQLRSGDIITHLNGVSTKDLPLQQLLKQFRGEAGTQIGMTIRRAAEHAPLQLTLERELIRVASVSSRLLSSGYGYISIRHFAPRTVELVVQAIGTLDQQAQDSLRGFIVDVRDNKGGLLASCVGAAAAFLGEQSPVVRVDGRTKDNSLRLNAAPSSWTRPGSPNPLAGLPRRARTLPVAVLVNNESASCAEILAAALQDNRRAQVLGVRTLGFSSITTVYHLRSKDALKLTTAIFVRPNGDALEGIGVIPDVTIDESPDRRQNIGDFLLQQAEIILGRGQQF